MSQLQYFQLFLNIKMVQLKGNTVKWEGTDFFLLILRQKNEKLNTNLGYLASRSMQCTKVYSLTLREYIKALFWSCKPQIFEDLLPSRQGHEFNKIVHISSVI